LIVIRARGRWTTDPEWHAFSAGSLLAGICWFIVAALIGLGQTLTGGATAAGWSLTPLVLPLGLGWVAQILVGSWSHLVPAVGPGSPQQHARQRTILGAYGRWRVVALNVGLALAVVGQLVAVPIAVQAGAVLTLAAGAVAVGLLAAAILLMSRPTNELKAPVASRT
jgi:nitrite reductase (NO-forming)